MKVGAIIQARYGSARLAGKVLMGLPMSSKRSVLSHIFQRVEASSMIEECVVATSEDSANDAIVEAFPGRVFRGNEDDVLKRFYECAQASQFDVIVRLTGDNPCLDFSLLDPAIQAHLDEGADYTITKGLPLGMNTEILSFKALEQAHQSSDDSYEREHVTPYLSRHADQFQVREFELSAPENTQELRLTMDYPSDYALLNLIFSHFGDHVFSLAELSDFVTNHPWATEVNRNHQKQNYPSEEQEIEAAICLLEQGELSRAAGRLRQSLD